MSWPKQSLWRKLRELFAIRRRCQQIKTQPSTGRWIVVALIIDVALWAWVLT